MRVLFLMFVTAVVVIPFKTEVQGQKPRASIKAVNVNRYRSVDITGYLYKLTCCKPFQ